MDPKEALKLELWKQNHITPLGLSCLIDDEIEGGLEKVMRHHIKKCGLCRERMAMLLRVEHLHNPKG